MGKCDLVFFVSGRHLLLWKVCLFIYFSPLIILQLQTELFSHVLFSKVTSVFIKLEFLLYFEKEKDGFDCCLS